MRYPVSFLLLIIVAAQVQAAREFEVIDFKEAQLDLTAQIEQIKDMNADLCSFLRVESDVEGELYLTDIKVYERVKKSSGVFGFFISFRERNITFTSPGYMPHRYKIPVEMEKGKTYVVRLRSTGSGIVEGKGNIRIETEPSGAKITFNNLPVPELTPCTIEDQKVGSHLIRIVKEGYDSLETTVEVEKDQTITRHFTLTKQYASLKVTSDPSEAQVYLDGNLIGTTPLERSDLSSGEAILVISKEGFEPSAQPVRLNVDQIKPVHADLFHMTGSVEIITEPQGATVYLDDQELGIYKGTALKREKLSLGRHTVRAVLEGYYEASATFNVEYNKTVPVNLTLKPKPGALFVVTTPDSADIYLDDRNTLQKTPYKLENVAAGQHKLRMTLAGYGDVVKTITVRPGKTETVNETMRVEPKIEPYPAAASGEITGRSSVESPILTLENLQTQVNIHIGIGWGLNGGSVCQRSNPNLDWEVKRLSTNNFEASIWDNSFSFGVSMVSVNRKVSDRDWYDETTKSMSNNWLILDFGKLNKNSVNKDRSILGAGILIDFGDANTDMNRQLTGSGNTHYACIFKVGRMKVFNNNTRIYYHAFINPFFYFSMLCDNFSVLSGGDVRLMKQEFMGNYQCGTFYIEKRLPGNLNFCLGFFAKEDVGFLLSLSAGFPTLK